MVKVKEQGLSFLIFNSTSNGLFSGILTFSDMLFRVSS